MQQRKPRSKFGCLSLEKQDQKNMEINNSKYMININKQPFPRTFLGDQFKNICLTRTIDYI